MNTNNPKKIRKLKITMATLSSFLQNFHKPNKWLRGCKESMDVMKNIYLV